MRLFFKSFQPGLVVALMLFFLQLSSAGQAAGRTLYVSPEGNDTWSGFPSEPSADGTDGPLATLDRARLRVRELGADQQQEAVTVLLRKGVYQQHQPLRFTPEDSGTAAAPITYAAYPGERPIISGGLSFSGWTAAGPLWQAPAPRTAAGQVMRFNQLYVNGERRTRARMPNRGSFFRTDGPVPQNKSRSFYFHEGDLHAWPGAPDALVVIYHSWETSIHRIRYIDKESGSVLLHEAAPWAMGNWERQQRYYVENLREALDEPGEWFLDHQRGVVLYYPLPGETPASVKAVAPVLPGTLLFFEGDLTKKQYIEHLHFQGLAFQHTDANLHRLRNPGQGEINQPGLIQAEGLRYTKFTDCVIANSGGHAIWLGAGCSHNLLERCHLHDLGGGGVYIGGGWGIHDQFPASHNTVDNCLIRDGSHMFHGAHGVWIGKSSYNRITHNEISNFDYTGISCGWSWGFQPSTANHNILDNNAIHHLGNGEGLSDMGGIYTLGLSPGTTIRNNHIHDVYNYAFVSHGSGIYPDEGSTDIMIEGNLVYRVRNSPLFMHYGQDCTVRNNILALGGEGQLRRSREDKRCHYIAVGNIVYGGTNPRMLDGPWKNHDWQLGSNIYWSVDGKPDFAGMDFATWQPFAKDVGSRVADPLFVDPEKDDFRLRPESPALAMGFRPIDPALAGLYGDSSWTGLPRRYADRVCREYARPVDPPMRVYFDFESDAVGSVPSEGAIVAGENGASVLIANDHASGGRQSLKFTDAPDQKNTWTPHLYYKTAYTQGVVRLTWEMRNAPEAPATFSMDLRQYDTGAAYRTGPAVAVAADGTVRASGQEIGKLPVGVWAHVSVEMILGPTAPARYQLTFTIPGQVPIVRELPYVDPAFRRIDWLGFSSLSTQAAVYHIDNLMLGTEEELAQPPKRRKLPGYLAARKRPQGVANDQQLAGHWSFEKDDQNLVKDLSGNNNYGEMWARYAYGDFGRALFCDAEETHVQIENHASLNFGTGNFAIDLWLMPLNLAADAGEPRRRILSKSDHPRAWWVLDITDEGHVRLEVGVAGQSGWSAQSRAAIPEKSWSYVAIVVDRTAKTIQIFVNGEADSIHPLPEGFTASLDVAADLTLGSTWRPYIGLLDEVRIFTRALSEAEVLDKFQREQARMRPSAFELE